MRKEIPLVIAAASILPFLACTSDKDNGVSKEQTVTTKYDPVPDIAESIFRSSDPEKIIGLAEDLRREGLKGTQEHFRATKKIWVHWNMCISWSDENGLVILVRRPAQIGGVLPTATGNSLTMDFLAYAPPITSAGGVGPSYTDVELKNGPFIFSGMVGEANITRTSHESLRKYTLPTPQDESVPRQVTVRIQLEQGYEGIWSLRDEATGASVMETWQGPAEAFPTALTQMCGLTPQDGVAPSQPFPTS